MVLVASLSDKKADSTPPSNETSTSLSSDSKATSTAETPQTSSNSCQNCDKFQENLKSLSDNSEARFENLRLELELLKMTLNLHKEPVASAKPHVESIPPKVSNSPVQDALESVQKLQQAKRKRHSFSTFVLVVAVFLAIAWGIRTTSDLENINWWVKRHHNQDALLTSTVQENRALRLQLEEVKTKLRELQELNVRQSSEQKQTPPPPPPQKPLLEKTLERFADEIFGTGQPAPSQPRPHPRHGHRGWKKP